MNSRVAIVGMAFLTIIVLSALQTGDGGTEYAGASAGDEVAREDWPGRPSSKSLTRYPRAPVPRTYPGDWVRSEDYPGVALNNELEGTLAFRVMVDPYGEVSHCVVMESSGIKAFDERACAAITTRARFYPAFDADQQPVAGTYTSRVRWQIAE